MAYISNPHAPRARRDAVNLVLYKSYTKAQAARKTGVHRSTIGRWIQQRQRLELAWSAGIPTLSSAPKTHPNGLDPIIVAQIIQTRLAHNRCAVIVWRQLCQQGIGVSLSSVKRTLQRQNLIRPKSKWQRYRPRVQRPRALAPGDLVQVDTIHFIDWRNGQRFYVYTLIDLYSRWAWAAYNSKCRQDVSLAFVLQAQRLAPFRFKMIQTDNGPEFQRYFADQLRYKGLSPR
jgi:IS30 family transposase